MADKRISYYEAKDASPEDAISKFRAWKTSMPNYKWKRAYVHHNEGLTLFYDRKKANETIALHFTHATCGRDDDGSIATLNILKIAGFGNVAKIRSSLHTSSEETFKKE